MKKLLAIIALLVAVTVFSIASPAWAADVASGAKIFTAKCASCHMGGKNVVVPNKTLQKSALEKYDMYSLESIIAQVTNGKNAMPAWGSQLSKSEIEDVATYVLAQADRGW
jgi:cytochrome c6